MRVTGDSMTGVGLNEGPLQKEGQCQGDDPSDRFKHASMKGPSRRRGNFVLAVNGERQPRLNEGPLQKEGQSVGSIARAASPSASMKGPSRRRGNWA